MMDYTELDFHEDGYNQKTAIEMLEWKLKNWKAEHIHCVTLIHGFGSKGTGCVMAQPIRQFLQKNKNRYKIQSITNGEDPVLYDLLNRETQQLRAQYPEIKQKCEKRNPGITIIKL